MHSPHLPPRPCRPDGAFTLLPDARTRVPAIATRGGQPLGNGRSGPIYERLYAGHPQAKKELFA